MTYTTTQGDTWDAIAYKAMGDAKYTDKLIKLNPKYVRYYTFPSGIVLELPSTEIREANTLPPWKKVVG